MQYFGFDRPSFGIKTYGFGSSEFSPLDLFAGGKQGAWYDPSDKSTLFQDAAGTVLVTKDGDPVGLMLDKSGNSNHATQSVSASRPIYKTDGILHWLEFDGTDDILQTDSNFTVGNGFYACAANAVRSYTERGITPFFGALFGIYSQTLQLRVDGAANFIGVGSRSSISPDSVVSSSLYILNTPFIHSGGHDSGNNLYVKSNSSGYAKKENVLLTDFPAAPIVIGRAAIKFYGGVWIDVALDDSKNIEEYFANKTGVII